MSWTHPLGPTAVGSSWMKSYRMKRAVPGAGTPRKSAFTCGRLRGTSKKSMWKGRKGMKREECAEASQKRTLTFKLRFLHHQRNRGSHGASRVGRKASASQRTFGWSGEGVPMGTSAVQRGVQLLQVRVWAQVGTQHALQHVSRWRCEISKPRAEDIGGGFHTQISRSGSQRPWRGEASGGLLELELPAHRLLLPSHLPSLTLDLQALPVPALISQLCCQEASFLQG